MAKYHISKKGTLEVCLAFFRNCPCQQHFDNKEDGIRYIEQWEENRLNHPALAQEDILEPRSRMLSPTNIFKNQDNFKGLYLTDDSFAVVLNGGIQSEHITEHLQNLVDKRTMKWDHIGRAVDRTKDPVLQMYFEYVKERSIANKKATIADDKFQKEQTAKQYLSTLVDRLKQEGYTTDDILDAFDYQTDDILIDKHTIIRVFSRKKPIIYEFDEVYV